MTLKNYTFLQICQMIIIPAFFDTMKMLIISGILSTILGFFLGVILIITEKGGLCENVVVNRILDFFTVVPFYYPDDFDYPPYEADCGKFHRGQGSYRSAYGGGNAFHGSDLPEQF